MYKKDNKVLVIIKKNKNNKGDRGVWIPTHITASSYFPKL